MEIELLENSSSPTWNLVEKISTPKWNKFDHSHLLYGICLNDCKIEVNKLDPVHLNKFNLTEPSQLPRYMTDWSTDYKRSYEDRVKYGDLINKCIKNRIMKRFKINSHARISYCNYGDDDVEKVGMTQLKFVKPSKHGMKYKYF